MNLSISCGVSTPFARKILTIITGLALVYYAWMMFDLLARPFDAGANAIIIPFLFRWLSGFCGTVTVVVAVFILRRMPGNVIGLLLLLYGVGAISWSERLDLAEFSSAARREVALHHLTTQLVNVVEKTVQPERVSIWLRKERG